jgi:hypothetical protein
VQAPGYTPYSPPSAHGSPSSTPVPPSSSTLSLCLSSPLCFLADPSTDGNQRLESGRTLEFAVTPCRLELDGHREAPAESGRQQPTGLGLGLKQQNT